MIRFRKWPVMAALLVGVSMLAAPTQARAAYAVRVYDDGVLQAGITQIIDPMDPNSLVFFGSTTHFAISQGSGLSNNPGTQGGSNLDLSSNQLIRTTFGTAGGSHTIRIELTQTDWFAPTGTPLALTSSAGGSFAYVAKTPAPPVAPTGTVSATYQGFLDNTNALFGQPGAGSTPLQTASASRNTVGTSALVFAPPTSVNVNVPGGTPFSITNVLTFTFTLGANSGQDSANVSASSVASVPAPAGVVLALTGLPVLGMGTWLRRRLRARQTTA